MTPKASQSSFSPERCQYRTPTGRQCCSPVANPSSSFCPQHAARQLHEFGDFVHPLTRDACSFLNAQGINCSLNELYTLLAQGRISPRRAAPPSLPISAACSCAPSLPSTMIAVPTPDAPPQLPARRLCNRNRRRPPRRRRSMPPNQRSSTDEPCGLHAIFNVPHG
jgi:hypothetical protein